jgi:hypothetical protein
MTGGRRLATVGRAFAALVTTAALVVGVPIALVRLVGSPLPTRLPALEQVRAVLDQGVADRFWLKALALVVWLAWIQLAAALVREVVAVARGRVARPRFGGWAHDVAGRLVATIALATTVIGPPAGARAQSLPEAAAGLAARPAPVAEQAAPVPAFREVTVTHTVVRGESLSSIAGDELGDQRSWPRLWAANRGRSFGSRVFRDPNLILPGWDLAVPKVEPVPVAASEPVTPVLIPPLVVKAPTPTPRPLAVGRGATPASSPRPRRPARTLSEGLAARPPLDDAPTSSGAPAWARLSGALGATLLATGVVASVAGRRRRAARAASSSSALVPADPELAPLLTTLQATSDTVRTARLELALRALAGRLGRQRSVARPVAVRSSASGRLEVALDHPAALDAPWVGDGDGGPWVLPADVPLTALTDDARDVAPPCPALVGVGQDDDGEVYVDLEALPVLNLGPSEAAADLLRLVTATLATTPLADELRVLVVGADLPGLVGRHDVQTAPTVAAAVAEVEAMTAGIAAASAGEPSTFRLRAVAGHEPWEPVVVVVPRQRHRIGADSVERVALARLGELAGAHRGVAVVGADVGESPWRLHPHGREWRLEPLGWPVWPHGLTEGELTDVGVALQAAAAPAVEAVADVSDPGAVPAWSLMARVLGPVDVVDRSGNPVLFDRAKSLELVIWLAQHSTTATRSGARSALWGWDVSNGSFSNVVSEARRALARLVPPPDGEDWLARTYAERLPLHPAVVLDAEVVAAHLARSRALPDDAAITELRTALGYVRGVPYAGAAYLWPDAEALPSTLTLLVVSVASELAERCLTTGDVDGVFSATAVGLEVLPGHEELVALRMRAHAERGDLAAVRGEFASYEQAVMNDPWAGGDLAPKLTALREQLLGHGLPAAGA